MPISREHALLIIKYLLDHPTFYFPFVLVCKGYASNTYKDDDFVEIIPSDDYENLVENRHYDTFELWENVQKLDVETLQLMSKGFIEHIMAHSIETELLENAKKYRALWKEELWESTDIEKFAQNEYFGAKAEGFEESLEIFKKHLASSYM
ncbi:hypothetical protein [Sulfurospirillum deleyianum]|uniref:Uncharacterized protein n=1 Tax=Sulfurospirillum deleyianum (strain ATCC 51133 / DSM 6946 / 5175) TaxID=525898 RepID=D1B378_SULD5|nr:hypothetical protein [Sulfurospirillum deleyianum]ACZ12548.1 hypothetical protein Sdel_1532 [Sulfurospirillum deleyianum DSM 6946]